MTREVRRFQAAARHFLAERNALFPHEASELGLAEFDADLGENGIRVYQSYLRLLHDVLKTVEATPDCAFGGDDWLDRRGFLSLLRTELLLHEKLERWRTNPQIHCDAAIQAIFGLVVRHPDDLSRVRRAVESRLRKLPQFLAAGASIVRKPVPLWTKLATQTCEGAVSFLDGLEKQWFTTETSHRIFAEARSAFKGYAQTIENKSPGPKNGFAIGRDAFEFLIREKLGLPYSLPEAEALGQQLIAQLQAGLKTEAKKFGRKSAAQLIEAAAENWSPSSSSLLNEYARVTAHVRQAFVEADLLTLPAREKLRVLPVPEFLRHHFPTAAYLPPGPFAKDQTGIFWVNDLRTRQHDAAQRAAEVRQHFGLELTCAHEGYPGHHVQFVRQNQHPSRLRRLFSHAIFYEGWTLWCEKMCVDFKIYDAPHARLLQLSDALWRAHRIVIDCGLHSGQLSTTSAARFLVQGTGFTPRRAEGDINWYTSAPTVPMSYLLGRLELEKLYARCVTGEGWTVKHFNDWILSFGAIPWSWIWQARLPPVASI